MLLSKLCFVNIHRDLKVNDTETWKHMSELRTDCRMCSVCQTEAPEEFDADSLFCILQTLAKYPGDEIKEHELRGT
jgi:hypothetical protein